MNYTYSICLIYRTSPINHACCTSIRRCGRDIIIISRLCSSSVARADLSWRQPLYLTVCSPSWSAWLRAHGKEVEICVWKTRTYPKWNINHNAQNGVRERVRVLYTIYLWFTSFCQCLCSIKILSVHFIRLTLFNYSYFAYEIKSGI